MGTRPRAKGALGRTMEWPISDLELLVEPTDCVVAKGLAQGIGHDGLLEALTGTKLPLYSIFYR